MVLYERKTMRDYRGKRKDGKGWVYGWYFEDKNCGGIVGKTCGFIIPHGAMVDDIDKALYGFVEVIPETVGQDTGEKDNDNMKIYAVSYTHLTLPTIYSV